MILIDKISKNSRICIQAHLQHDTVGGELVEYVQCLREFHRAILFFF